MPDIRRSYSVGGGSLAPDITSLGCSTDRKTIQQGTPSTVTIFYGCLPVLLENKREAVVFAQFDILTGLSFLDNQRLTHVSALIMHNETAKLPRWRWGRSRGNETTEGRHRA